MYRPGAVGPVQRTAEVRSGPPVYRPAALPGTRPPVCQALLTGRGGSNGAPAVYRPGTADGGSSTRHLVAVWRGASAIQRVKFYAGKKEYDTDEIIKDPSTISAKRSVPEALESIANGDAIRNKIGVKGNDIASARERKPFPQEIKDAKDALAAIAKSAVGKKKEKADKKRKRNEEEAELLEKIADSTTDSDHEKGRALAAFGERHMGRIHGKRLKTKKVKDGISTLNSLSAEAYDKDGPSMLDDLTPYEATLVYSSSKTKRFDHKIKDTKVMIDGYDGGRDGERDAEKVKKSVHLPTVKIQISNKSSYRHFSEAKDPPADHPGHPMLLALETQRELRSASTNLLKETIYQADGMTHTERFSAESEFSYMEPQGANKPLVADKPSNARSQKLLRVQETSSIKVLRHGNTKIKDTPLGQKVGTKEQTTSGKLHTAFSEAYKAPGTKKEKFEKKKRLSREYLRVVRSGTGMDIESEDENLSETEFNETYT